MGEAVAKAVNVYRYRAEREGVELATEIEPALPRAHIDDRAIQLAVINLIDNALKYAPGSEVVSVRVSRESGRGVRGLSGQSMLVVRVASARATGQDRPIRGSGIGLALVKHIAESHGGRAWVEEVRGAGATFAVSIPVAG